MLKAFERRMKKFKGGIFMDTNNNEVLENGNMENGNVTNEVNEATQNLAVQTEVVQEEVTQQQAPQQNVEKNHNKNNLKILIGVVIVIILIGVACVFAMPGVFNSEETEFFDLLIRKQSVAGVANDIATKTEKSKQVDTKIKADISEILETFGADTGDTDLNVEVDISEVKSGDDMSGALELLLNKKSLGIIHFAKTGEMYGLKFADTTEKYLAFENNNLKELFENFDVEDTDEIPDKILTQKDFENVMKIDKATANKILDKYIKVLSKSVKGKVETKKNVKIEIDGKEIKTTQHTLTLNEKDTAEMALAMLKALKEDEKNIKLFIDDYKAILKLMEESGYATKEMLSYDDLPSTDEICEEFIGAIEETYEQLKEIVEEDDFDEDTEISLVIYEYKNEIVATKIVADDAAIVFECLNSEDVFIRFATEQDGKELAAIVLSGEIDSKKLDLELKLVSNGIKLKLITITQEYKSKADEEMIKLNKKTALIVNKASEEDLEEFAEELKEGLTKYLEDLVEEFPEFSSLFSAQDDSYDYDDFDYSDYYYDYDYDDFDYSDYYYDYNW